MPRRRPPYSPDLIYHVSARCTNKEWFALPLADVWTIMSNYLFFIHHAFGCRIYAFVLMSNHFHLLIKSPDEKLGVVMNYFMRETSRCIGFDAGRINQVYGSPYHPTLVRDERGFRTVYRYIYQNPLNAGVSKFVEDYEFSTLRQALGFSHGWIPLEADENLMRNPDRVLDSLNTKFSEESRNLIRLAMRKSEFRITGTSKKRARKQSEKIKR